MPYLSPQLVPPGLPSGRVTTSVLNIGHAGAVRLTVSARTSVHTLRRDGRQGRGRRLWSTLVVALMLAVAASCSSADEPIVGDRAADPADEVEQGEQVELAPPTPTPVPTPTPEGPRPILVVTLMGETGVMQKLDGPAVAGVAAEIERLNGEGGLLGREIELRRIDTNSRVSVVDRNAQRLVDSPPDLILVSCDLEFSRPMIEAANSAGLLTISPCADHPAYETGGLGSRNFTFGAPSSLNGELAGEAAIRFFGDTALVMRDNTSPEAQGFCDGFEQRFQGLGGTVAARYQFTYDATEAVQDLLAAEGPDTQVIALCSHVPGGVKAAPSLISMMRTLGFNAPIVSGSSVDQFGWLTQVPQLNDMIFVSWSSIYGNDPDQRVNDVIDRANDDPTTPVIGGTTILGADSIRAWAIAVERVDSVAPGAVSAALGAFNDQEMATGSITFAAGNRMDSGRLLRVLRVQDGDLRVEEVREVGVN